jgi:hypothetical protein
MGDARRSECPDDQATDNGAPVHQSITSLVPPAATPLTTDRAMRGFVTSAANAQAEQPSGAGLLKPVVGRDSRTRYSRSMKLSIDLSPAQAERLRLEAERLGLTPEDLARAAIADLLATAGEDFKAAAERVLKKNEELYRRLA